MPGQETAQQHAAQGTSKYARENDLINSDGTHDSVHPRYQTHGRGTLLGYTLAAKKEARHEPTFHSCTGFTEKTSGFSRAVRSDR